LVFLFVIQLTDMVLSQRQREEL